MDITINDKTISVAESATLQQVLEAEGINPTGIATAVNNDVISRDKRSSHVLNPGDRIIIIKAFYGG